MGEAAVLTELSPLRSTDIFYWVNIDNIRLQFSIPIGGHLYQILTATLYSIRGISAIFDYDSLFNWSLNNNIRLQFSIPIENYINNI